MKLLNTQKMLKMDQDDLEEEIFYKSMAGHVELIAGILSSSPTAQSVRKLFWRIETLLIVACLIIVTLSIIRFDKKCRFIGFLRQIFSIDAYVLESEESQEGEEWESVEELSVVYSTQGLRATNEDRAVTKKVEGWGQSSDGTIIRAKDDTVHIFAILDGHGGEFSANFAKKYLFDALEKSISKLKLLTSSVTSLEKLKQYEMMIDTEAPKSVLTYLGISDSNYQDLHPSPSKTESENSSESEGSREREKSTKEDCDENSNSSNSPKAPALVLSSRLKALVELPIVSKIVNSKKKSTEPLKASTFQAKSKFTPKTHKKIGKKEAKPEKPQAEITDYISEKGEILYPSLIKDEISKCDKELLVNAKKAGAIGGTTLLLAILDSGKLWVANVGDSRGVLCNDKGVAIPMSFDHKPSQLKEKKRIQEAGGFISLNGVWRVQGVLATSRALGDYPLKEQNVIVSDPDVLSFDVKVHKPAFAVLASDGLWDTHSNEEAVAFIKTKIGSDRLLGAKDLALDALDKGSLDNVTIQIINF